MFNEFLKKIKKLKNALIKAGFTMKTKCARNKYLDLYKSWKKCFKALEKWQHKKNGKKLNMWTIDVW